MAMAYLLLLLPLGAWSQSVSSCGAAGDHIKDAKITVSPDPIARGKAFTVDISGTLDAALTSMNADIDMSIQALHVVNTKINKSVPFSLSPAIATGPVKLTIGPLTLPSLPGTLVATGTIKVTNDKKEPVACIKLNLNVPAMSDEEEVKPEEVSSSSQGEKISICSKPSDHLHNLTCTSSGGVGTLAGTLDETVTKLTANADLELKIGFFSHKIDMAIPIAYSPGFPKGAFKMTAGPSQELSLTESLVSVGVSGTVKINDGASSEIACLSIAKALADADEQQSMITV